jgi:hypothetical protein
MTDAGPTAPEGEPPPDETARRVSGGPDDEMRHPTHRLHRALAIRGGAAPEAVAPETAPESPEFDLDPGAEARAPGEPWLDRRALTRRTLVMGVTLALLVAAATSAVVLTPAHRAPLAVVTPTPTPISLPAAPPARPSARVDAAMAYDYADGNVLLYGGLVIGGSGLRTLDDTWSWNGAEWSELDPATSPPPLSAALLGYDPVTKELVLTGGDQSNRNNGLVEADATWTWDGSSWSAQPSGGLPASELPDAMATDQVTGQLILVTASAGCQGTETWRWSGGSWVLLHPATSPPGASVDGLAFDPAAGRLDLLEAPGGCGGSAVATSATPPAWSWNGSTWSPDATPAASALSASWELTTSAQGTLLVSSAGTYLQGDGEDGQWTEVSTSPAAGDSSVAYDAGDGQVVLFGGICVTCGADAVPYTWTWDGDWILRDSTAATATPPATPSQR